MAIFMQIGDIKGEATDHDHKDWVICEKVQTGVKRSIPEGAKDSQRSRGATTLGSIMVDRDVDKSSVPLLSACANGTFFDSVEIHFCTQVGNVQQPYLKYVLLNVIVSAHELKASESGVPIPTDAISLEYTEAEWTYVTVNPKTGIAGGVVIGSFDPGQGKSK